jgi:hypothetical protein
MGSTETVRDEMAERFDRGEEVLDLFAPETAEHPNSEPRKLEVDLPVWMVNALDGEARRLGCDRQAIIEMWIAEHLERMDRASAAR